MPALTRLIGTVVIAAAPLIGTPASAAMAAGRGSVPLPFEAGEPVQIVQGYNGGTHVDASVYGLDLVLADGGTSGAPVLAPFDGTVPWAFAPGERTGCIEILASDREFGATLCHVLLDRPFVRGDRVSRGQQIGVVGAPGMVGNNGLAHVHMELHIAGRDADIVPFSAAQGGLPLDGMDLPATGAYNEHAGDGPIVSSNVPSTATAVMALATW